MTLSSEVATPSATAASDRESAAGMGDSSDEAAGGNQVVVGLVADPGLPAEVALRLSDELPEVLARQVSDQVCWQLCVTTEELTLDEDDRVPIEVQARDKMPARGWDILICLTDLPRHSGTHPVVADVNTSHGVALASLPAIGWLRPRRHVRDVVVHLIAMMAGETLQLAIGRGEHHRLLQRTAALVSPVRGIPSERHDTELHLTLTGTRGWARLLVGMIRDNRPWRLVPSLSKALAAAAAVAAFGIFYPTIWGMADALTPARLAGVSVFAVGMMVGWLTVYNGLWERPHGRHDRGRALLYNLATVLTLALGVTCIYLLLFGVTLLGAAAVISPDYLHEQLGHPVNMADYLTLVWLASSMGTVAGALGSSLETEDAVRRATYSRREQERRARERERQQETQADSDDS
jgi:heme exporter protein D